MKAVRLAFTCALAFALTASAQIPKDAEIRKILVERIDARKQGVGIVVGVIEPNGRRIVSYGSFDLDKRSVNGDTLFEIGSATKVFTALLLADAVQRGEVAFTDPVSKFLPETVKMPRRGDKVITLEDLATQTSGLPRMPSNFAPKNDANPYADYTVQQLYDFLSSYELPRDPGAQYEYSNLGYGLLGHVLALRAGVDYEKLVRTRVTAPLTMKSTGITLTDALQRRLAPGHDDQRRRVANWDLPALAGAGALRSSANDLLNFLAAALRQAQTPLAPAFKSLLNVKRPTPRANLHIALGWHVTTLPNGNEIVWHNGGTGGYRSFMGYDTKNRNGVVVLSNMNTVEGVDDIGIHLLDSSLPLIPAPPSIDTSILERYPGIYSLGEKFALRITHDNGRLFLQATGQPKFELFPSSETKFFVKEFDAKVAFVIDANNRVTGLVLHQNGEHEAQRVDSHPFAPTDRTTIAVDSKLFDRYVGTYQLAPTFAITITRDGDRLFAQATAQPRLEIFPENERKFFYREVDAQITFVVEGDGPATKLILHQAGMDQEAKRVP